MPAWIRNALTGILLCTVLIMAVRTHRAGLSRKLLRADQMEISHITYGMFDPTQWRDILSRILETKVEEFELTGSNREEVHKRAVDLMNGLLTEVEQVIERRNKAKGPGGVLKNMVMDMVVNVDDIRSGIPRYADMIVAYANDPRNKEEMRCFVVEKLQELGSKTDGRVDRTMFEAALARYGTDDPEEARTIIRSRIARLDDTLHTTYSTLAIACLALLILAIMAPSGSRVPLGGLILAGLCLLIIGLLLPMIDIEARISEFNLVLIGEPISFKDQVLFHQSKSILQVVRVLMHEGKPELMLVGGLVFTFSVLVPTVKMCLSVITLARGRMPKGRVASYLVNKAGKWSMADVMVVAIFMAFIGFNGVVDSQLATLEEYASGVHVLTTNNSSLEVGFYLFTGYCIMGLICAALLPKAIHAEQHIHSA